MTSASEPGIADPRLDYLYREYVRLSASVEKLAETSFQDFGLLASVGAVAAWPPLVGWLTNSGGPSTGLILFVGFSVILLIVAIIATRDLLKQSLILYLGKQLQSYEIELKGILDLKTSPIFSLALDLPEWTKTRHSRITRRFRVFFALVLIVFPFIVLALVDPYWYAGAYVAVAFSVLLVYASARSILENPESAGDVKSLEQRFLTRVRSKFDRRS
jgi:hypothetical protein